MHEQPERRLALHGDAVDPGRSAPCGARHAHGFAALIVLDVVQGLPATAAAKRDRAGGVGGGGQQRQGCGCHQRTQAAAAALSASSAAMVRVRRISSALACGMDYTVDSSFMSETDAELAAVKEAARPIRPRERDTFLRRNAPEISLASMVEGVLTSLYTRPAYRSQPPGAGIALKDGGKNGTAVPGHHCYQHVHAGRDGADSSVHAIRPPQLAASSIWSRVTTEIDCGVSINGV